MTALLGVIVHHMDTVGGEGGPQNLTGPEEALVSVKNTELLRVLAELQGRKDAAISSCPLPRWTITM